ncbi:MAG: hypothetical protein JO265_07940 [Acidimicrobiia bacterium]|nr:hypothetical protein [Acidimicrobiia bacterium]
MLEREPAWDADSHLDRVYRRGRQLRRRRRVAVLAAPAALTLLGALLVGGGLPSSARPVRVAQGGWPQPPGPGGDGTRSGGGVESVDGRSRTPGATTAANAPGTPGTPGADPSTPSGGPNASSAPSTDPGPGSPSTPSGRASGQETPAGSRTQAPTTAAPTSASPTAAGCPSTALDYATVTDRSSYAPGQSVSIALVVHNHSTRPCDGPGPCGIGPWASVQNASGAVVWQSHPIAVACTNPPPAPPRLAPGQSVTYPAGTWNQQLCAVSGGCAGQAPAGSYRAAAHRGNVKAAAARFTIT